MKKVVRTETTVKEIDAEGEVIREITTTVQIEQPPPPDISTIGMYL